MYDKRKYFPRFNSGKRQCSSSRRNRNSLDQFSDGIRSKCLLQINERPNAKSVYSTSPALKEISSWTEDFWYTIDASTFRKIARKVKVNAGESSSLSLSLSFSYTQFLSLSYFAFPHTHTHSLSLLFLSLTSQVLSLSLSLSLCLFSLFHILSRLHTKRTIRLAL